MTLLHTILHNYKDTEIMMLDGFDDAVMGIEYPSMRLIYSVKKILDVLQKEMSEQDAVEYFTYNIWTAYVGEKTPIFCVDDFNDGLL